MNKEKSDKASKKSCGGNRAASNNNPGQKEKERNYRRSQIDQLSGFIDALADILVEERLRELGIIEYPPKE